MKVGKKVLRLATFCKQGWINCWKKKMKCLDISTRNVGRVAGTCVGFEVGTKDGDLVGSEDG